MKMGKSIILVANSTLLFKITIIILFVFLSAPKSFSESILKLKNGNELNWSNYEDNGDSFCTYKGGGLLCIEKKDVVSIKEGSGDSVPLGANVVTEPEWYKEKRKAEEEMRRAASTRGDRSIGSSPNDYKRQIDQHNRAINDYNRQLVDRYNRQVEEYNIQEQKRQRYNQCVTSYNNQLNACRFPGGQYDSFCQNPWPSNCEMYLW